MNLRFLKNVKQLVYSTRVNPYYFRFWLESCHTRVIASFFRIASPVFNEKEAEKERRDTLSLDMDVHQENTYEWDLGQKVPELLWMDLNGLLAFIFSSSVFRWFARGIRHLEIYFYLDDIDEGKEWHGALRPRVTDNSQILMEDKGGHSFRGSFIIIYPNPNGVAPPIHRQSRNEDVIFEDHGITVPAKDCHATAIKNGRILSIYRIRGPSDPKNIFHHLSDKIISLLSPHENCGNRSQRSCRGQPMQGAHQEGACCKSPCA